MLEIASVIARPRAVETGEQAAGFMQDQVGWHGKAPNKEQYEQAMKELGVEA